MRKRIAFLIVALLMLAGSLVSDLGTGNASANVYCPAYECCVDVCSYCECPLYRTCGFDRYNRCQCTVCDPVY